MLIQGKEVVQTQPLQLKLKYKTSLMHVHAYIRTYGYVCMCIHMWHCVRIYTAVPY